MSTTRSTLLCAWLAAGALAFAGGCDDAPMDPDAGTRPDTGPPTPQSVDHCLYEDVPPTANTGGTVESGALEAGVAEAPIDLPLGSSLGAYTGRAEAVGRGAFLPPPDARRTRLAGGFAPSIGIETIPKLRALAVRAGGETAILIKADLGASYQGLVYDLERALGEELAGKVIIASSHSHSSYGNFTGHEALWVGFSNFRQVVYDSLIEQLEAVARAALADLRPARIGFAYDPNFDPENRVNRDRRGENDELVEGCNIDAPCNENADCDTAAGEYCSARFNCLPASCREDDHHLFVIRVDDDADGSPMAVIPVFGIHGTIHGERNAFISTDSVGGIERVLEESFDSEVMVMHLQGAGADVSPAGSGVIDCSDREVCSDYGRPETVGHYGVDAIRAAWESAGASMQTELPIEMLTRNVPLGPNWETFTVREGALEYAPWDGRTESDGIVYGDDGAILSPIDEFNAPHGAALCGNDSSLGIRLPRSKLPGSDDLFDTSYYFCNQIDQILTVIGFTFDIEFTDTPICETTQTTLSALRLGDWMIATLPGEPTTQLIDHMRQVSPMAAEQTIVVGYAQDHGGYLLRPEDWLRGGYEPSITFWGPLEGEYVMEQAVRVMEAAATAEREDATAEGFQRVATPMVDDDIPLDTSPVPVGSVPDTLPEYILTRLLEEVPSAQPAATVERIQTVYFTFVGDDPIRGTPRVYLQREVDGTFEDVLRRSGRPVMDGDLILSWTPNPIFREEGTPRAHYYTVEFQAAAPMGMPGLEAIEDRVGLPLGRYRFRIEAPTYELTSEPFEVTPATLVTSAEAAGADLAVTLGVLNENGYRVLRLGAPSNHLVPLPEETITVVVDAGEPQTIDTDASGVLTIPGAAGAGSITVTDRFGNTATFSP